MGGAGFLEGENHRDRFTPQAAKKFAQALDKLFERIMVQEGTPEGDEST